MSTTRRNKRNQTPIRKRKTQPLVVQRKKANETTRLGSLLRSLGTIGGGALGSLVGQPGIGASAGNGIGASLSRWLGSGDYAISNNSLVSRGSDGVAMMHKTSQSVIIRHREFIADVFSGSVAGAFQVMNSFQINPGLSQSYPWLAPIAAAYQEYTIRGMIYHYVPTSGESVASTSTALGSVVLATNYRSTAPTYVNKQQMLNEFFSSDSKPSEAFCHPIECDPRENPYNVQYVRSAGVPSGEDPKTYDLGTVSVATVGYPAANVNLGELWVTYEIELRKPIANAFLDPLALYAHTTFGGPTGSGSAPFNLPSVRVNNFPVAPAFSGITLTLPANIPGTYMFIYAIPSVSATACTATWQNATNATLVNLAASGVAGNTMSPVLTTIVGGAGGVLSVIAAYTVVNPSLAMTVDLNLSFAGSVSAANVYVINIPTQATY